MFCAQKMALETYPAPKSPLVLLIPSCYLPLRRLRRQVRLPELLPQPVWLDAILNGAFRPLPVLIRLGASLPQNGHYPVFALRQQESAWAQQCRLQYRRMGAGSYGYE
jgi:hypothetical protein